MTNISAKVSHNGNPPFVRVAALDHSIRNGTHIFKSKKIPGLLVMNKSMEAAIAQLPVVIADLIRMNEGFDCEVTLGVDSVNSKQNEQQPEYAVIGLKAA